MTIKEPKLDLKMYPVLTWKRKPKVKEKEMGVTSAVDVYYDCYKGIKTEDLSVLDSSKNYQIIPKKNGVIEGFTVEYLKKFDVIRISFYYLETVSLTRIVKWNYMFSVCIDKNKKVFTNKKQETNYYNCHLYTKINNGFWCITNNGDEYSEVKYSAKLLNLWQIPANVVPINVNERLTDDEGEWAYDCKDIFKPFREFFGAIVPISGNKMLPLDSCDNINSFLLYSEPSNSAVNKNTKRLDELLNYKLDDVVVPKNMKLAQKKFGLKGRYNDPLYSKIDKFAIIQRVKDSIEPLCVLRSFFVYDDEIKEGGRIYIGKKDVVSSKTLRDGTFMYQKLLSKPDNWNFSIETFDKEETKGTILEYFGEIIEEIDYLERGTAIWSFLSFPITEQIYKSGGSKYMKKVFHLSVYESPVKIIQRSFQEIKDDGKNFYEKLGVNSYQFYKLIDFEIKHMPACSIYIWWHTNKTPISVMKKILTNDGVNGFNISSIDNNTFDTIFEYVKKIFKNIKGNDEIVQSYEELYNTHNDTLTWMCDCLRLIYNLYNIKVLEKTFPMLNEVKNKGIAYTCSNYYGSHTSYGNTLIVFRDFMSMVNQCNYQSVIKPYFNTLEELGNMHDMMVELVNQQKDTIEMTKWNNRKNFWNKYLYSNDEYSVLVPEVPGDLATEGITLHHCVKSYISKVTDGITNIAFIRDNTRLSEPFYTVEIDNLNTIQQVHGSCNCNATPEILKFIKKWCNDKNLKLQSINKVR